jgi:hypothetical protein
LSDTPEAAFAASLAAAAALEPSNAETATGPKTAAPASDELDGETELSDGESPAGDDADEGDGDDDGQEADGEDDAEVSDGLSEVKEKFLAGDAKAALKALGLDPKLLDLNDAKFRTMRQGLKEADTKLAEATRLHTEAEASKAETKRMYDLGKKELGPVLQMKRLLAKGDFASAKDLLEACAPPGTTYRQIAEGIAAAASGMSAAEQLYRRKLREIDERENAAKEPEPEKKAPAVDAGKNLEGAKKMLASTPLADIPGAAEALVRVAAENWDAEKRGFKVPRADLLKLVQKDPVISQLLELKALKAKGKKAPAPEPEAEELPVKRDTRGRFRERPRVESKLTPEQQRAAKQEADFKASIAEAAALERQQTRTAGKGRR